VVILIYVLLAYYVIAPSVRGCLPRIGLLLAGTLLGVGALWLNLDAKGRQPLLANAWLSPLAGLPTLDTTTWLMLLAALLVALAAASFLFVERKWRRGIILLLVVMAAYLVSRQYIADLTLPILVWGRGLGGNFWPRFAASLTKWINLLFQPPMAILGFTYTILGAFVAERFAQRARLWVALLLVAVGCALTFWGQPLALVGSPYIILAAYAVRSLPASVRAGVASLQQIDPAIEEASTNLGADAALTFRQVTLPLILPAFIAGLIFSFARHMTSLSAIIFLSSAKWPILTALIMSEVEQGGTSVAAAYSFVLILIVLAAIGLMYAIVGRAFRGGVELSMGAG
jgi:iron(III) transport system permease protein